jgi:hypothetical protein
VASQYPIGRSDCDTITISAASGDIHLKHRRVAFQLKFCERLARPSGTIMYANVTTNVVKGAVMRVFNDRPPYVLPNNLMDPVVHQIARKLGRYIERELDDEGLERALSKFPPKKRVVYREALAEHYQPGRDSRVTGFTKLEPVPLKDEDKPRLIHFRRPRFLAHMLSWYKPVEHGIYRCPYLINSRQKFVVSKGMDPLEKMDCIEGIMSRIGGVVYVCNGDGKAFEAHCEKGLLKKEHKLTIRTLEVAGYRTATISKARMMLKEQLVNKVTTRCSDGIVRYKIDGCRMSGDLNTGGGNTILTCLMIKTFVVKYRIPDECWGAIIDGDDFCFFMASDYVDLVGREIYNHFFLCGHELKGYTPIRVGEDLEVIDFCQARPVKVAGKWRLIRNPIKVYSGYTTVNLWYRDLESMKRFWATISHPEMIYARGVPILSSLFTMFHRLSGDCKPLEIVSRRYWLRNLGRIEKSIPESSISMDTRASFMKAFEEFDVGMQLSIEAELDAWKEAHIPSTPTLHSVTRFETFGDGPEVVI